MIKEDYVSFETAKLLKEKGFNERCLKEYYNGGVLSDITIEAKYNTIDNQISAPTLQMAQKWLREVYGIDFSIEINDPAISDRKYYVVIWAKNCESYILELFSSYEEALEEAIKYCLENLI